MYRDVSLSPRLIGSTNLKCVTCLQQGPILSGTYKLRVGGKWSTAIAFDASGSEFAAAVHAANPDYTIVVEDNNWSPLSGARYDIVFEQPLGDVGHFESDLSLLTGDNLALTITTIEDGDANDLFLDPIPGHLFEGTSNFKLIASLTSPCQ
jgi:hypothetical protein